MPTDEEKPFSPSCERNQAVILATLRKNLRASDQHLLEVGSGTGQHAVYFGQNLPHIIWQTSDVLANHIGIKLWLDEAKLNNVLLPIEYQIGHNQLPAENSDVVFSANTLHIISKVLVNQLIEDLGKNLETGARVIFYGPFKYQGEFTSDSNAEFDLWLRAIDPLRGVRDFEVIERLMSEQGLVMLKDLAMPANNQLLIFEKRN